MAWWDFAVVASTAVLCINTSLQTLRKPDPSQPPVIDLIARVGDALFNEGLYFALMVTTWVGMVGFWFLFFGRAIEYMAGGAVPVSFTYNAAFIAIGFHYVRSRARGLRAWLDEAAYAAGDVPAAVAASNRWKRSWSL